MLVSAQTQLDAPSVPISALTRRIGDHASWIVTRRENTGRDGTYEIDTRSSDRDDFRESLRQRYDRPPPARVAV